MIGDRVVAAPMIIRASVRHDALDLMALSLNLPVDSAVR